MTQSESGDRVSILNDAVDAQGEGRGGAQLALVEVTVGDSLLGLTLVHGNRAASAEIVVGQVDGGGGDLRAVDGELAGVEDMQAAVLQRSLNLGDLLGGAVGNFGAKVGDGDSAILIALAPVLRDVAGLRTLEQLLVVCLLYTSPSPRD